MEYREVSSKNKNTTWKKIEHTPFSERIRKASKNILDSTSKTVDSALKSAGNISKSTGDKLDDALEAAGELYEHTGIKKVVEKSAKGTKNVLAKTGVTTAATKVSEVAGEHLDTLTGIKVYKLVEERLAIQSRYNDILATKLDEALKRIELLESKISKLEK